VDAPEFDKKMTLRRRTIILSVFDTMFVFGMIVFLYVVGVSYFQPYWLSRQVFHLQEGISWLSWLRNDRMGVIAIAGSCVGFFGARVLRNSGNVGSANK
jgi:hypothetical protein